MALVVVVAIGLGAWRAFVLDATRRQVWTLQHDPVADRRRQAAEALAANPSGLRPEFAYGIFLRALDDPSPQVRMTAAVALEKFVPRSRSLAQDLARATRDPNRSVRNVSLYVLIERARSGRDRDTVIPVLIGALKDRPPGRSTALLEALAALPGAVPGPDVRSPVRLRACPAILQVSDVAVT
jgi:HEAT repeat protein